MSRAHASESEQSQISLDPSIKASISSPLSTENTPLFSGVFFSSPKYSTIISFSFLKMAHFLPLPAFKPSAPLFSFFSCPQFNTWLSFCLLLLEFLLSRKHISCSPLIFHIFLIFLLFSFSSDSLLFYSLLLRELLFFSSWTSPAFSSCLPASKPNMHFCFFSASLSSSQRTHSITSPLQPSQKNSLSSSSSLRGTSLLRYLTIHILSI